MKSKSALNKMVNVCGNILDERQEYLSQLYERCVVRKARVTVDDNSHVLAKCYEILPSVYDFSYQNLIQSAVNIISEQINLFKHQSSVCV